MDTINTYLDNIFANLPGTEQVLKARRELQANMEEKYRALKAEGRSENEAIGLVISEFGNIDELIRELGVTRQDAEKALPMAGKEAVQAYLAVNKQAGQLISLGVALCILGVATMILVSWLVEDGFINLGGDRSGGALGLIPMFIAIAAGVSLFIYSGMRLDKHYDWLDKGFELPVNIKTDLQQQLDHFTPNFTAAIIVGVGLCILSPLPLFLTTIFPDFKTMYGVVILLCLVAVGVYLFVRFGMIKDGYSRLLQLNDYTPAKKQENKVTSTLASIVFPLATVVFLYFGFVRQMWHPAWVIFPITGILFGIFSAIYEGVSNKN